MPPRTTTTNATGTAGGGTGTTAAGTTTGAAGDGAGATTGATTAGTTTPPPSGLGPIPPEVVALWNQLTPDLGAAVGLVAGALVFVAGWYLSKYLVRVVGRPIARRFDRPSVTRTVLRAVRVVAIVLTGVIAAAVAGIELPDILISVTVFSAVIGLVLAPIVGSVINGLFVLADRPYEIGDMVELSDTGQRGFVEDITIRYTKIFTLNNTYLVVPNATIRERDVVNYSGEDTRTRLSLQILVTYEGDLQEARNLIERAARRVDEVIEGGPAIRIGAARYPAGPTCYIDDFADHGVLLTLRYWAKEPYKLLTVRSRVQTEVWAELEDADVEIAYPHSHLVFDETSGRARVSVSEDGRLGPDSDPDLGPRPGGDRADPREGAGPPGDADGGAGVRPDE